MNGNFKLPKVLVVLLTVMSLFSASLPLGGEERKQDWQKLKMVQIQEYELFKEKQRRQHIWEELREAKTYLVNGNINKAERTLKKIQEKGILAKKVSYWYLAIIHFIRNDFEKSLEYLAQRVLISDQNFKQYCVLKILNLLILDKMSRINQEFNRCNSLNYELSPNDHFWLESLVKLRLKDPDLLAKRAIADFFNQPDKINDNLLRVLFKLVIYLNKEDTIEKWLNDLPEGTFDSDILRELVGFVYYRLGDPKKALEYIEDLSTPNAENIKGNIKLKNKEFELAFGHFQLALKKKKNSSNAIERSIPLAWMLRQWPEGTSLVQQTRENKANLRKRMTLLTAFLIQAGETRKAQQNLLALNKLFRGKMPKEANILQSYISLMANEKNNLRTFSEKACRQFDGMNCYILMQNSLWENLGKTIRRKDATYDDKELTFENLKERVELDPLDETIFIHQQDIEEMDHKIFQMNF